MSKTPAMSVTATGTKYQGVPYGYDTGDSPLPSPYLEDSNQKLKSRIRILRLISRIAGTILAICTASLEGKTLYAYITTHNIDRDGRGPWALQTSLWPAIMMFAASVLTAVLGVVIMGAYIRSIQAANRMNSVNTKISLSIEGLHILIWVVVAALYREGKNGHDLWGWACSPLAENIQPNFQGIVDFDAVCKRGSTNWALSIASPLVTAFNICILYLVFQRKLVQRELKAEKQSSPMRAF